MSYCLSPHYFMKVLTIVKELKVYSLIARAITFLTQFLVCRQRIDLGFLIDSSRSRYGSRAILRFIKETIRRFEVSVSKTRIGIVQFTSRVRLILGFGRTYNPVRIGRLIDQIRFNGRGGRLLGRALTYTERYLFRSRPRCGRRRVLIVLTTGESRDAVKRPAGRLFSSGVEIYAIGLGTVRRKSLQRIATVCKQVFRVHTRQLVSLSRIIQDKICSSTG